MLDFDFSIPTKVLFGVGRLDELKREKLPGKLALVVVSAGETMKRNGYLDRVLTALKHQGIEYLIFDKIRPNPSKAHVMEAAELRSVESRIGAYGIGRMGVRRQGDQ